MVNSEMLKRIASNLLLSIIFVSMVAFMSIHSYATNEGRSIIIHVIDGEKPIYNARLQIYVFTPLGLVYLTTLFTNRCGNAILQYSSLLSYVNTAINFKSIGIQIMGTYFNSTTKVLHYNVKSCIIPIAEIVHPNATKIITLNLHYKKVIKKAHDNNQNIHEIIKPMSNCPPIPPYPGPYYEWVLVKQQSINNVPIPFAWGEQCTPGQSIIFFLCESSSSATVCTWAAGSISICGAPISFKIVGKSAQVCSTSLHMSLYLVRYCDGTGYPCGMLYANATIGLAEFQLYFVCPCSGYAFPCNGYFNETYLEHFDTNLLYSLPSTAKYPNYPWIYQELEPILSTYVKSVPYIQSAKIYYMQRIFFFSFQNYSRVCNVYLPLGLAIPVGDIIVSLFVPEIIPIISPDILATLIIGITATQNNQYIRLVCLDLLSLECKSYYCVDIEVGYIPYEYYYNGFNTVFPFYYFKIISPERMCVSTNISTPTKPCTPPGIYVPPGGNLRFTLNITLGGTDILAPHGTICVMVIPVGHNPTWTHRYSVDGNTLTICVPSGVLFPYGLNWTVTIIYYQTSNGTITYKCSCTWFYAYSY